MVDEIAEREVDLPYPSFLILPSFPPSFYFPSLLIMCIMLPPSNLHCFTSIPISVYFFSLISPSQQTIAKVAEMIHTTSLIHDDIIDLSDSRRGKLSTHLLWGKKESVLAGNYILSRATAALARLGNAGVIKLLATVLDDLVRGE